ncbi:MAG: hypothetical protein IJ190_07815 [Prevotella sp.]|nr:hypothetical protein [Prevotella sp.]
MRTKIKFILILMLATSVSATLLSCGGDDNGSGPNLSSDEILTNIVGVYTGTFTNEYHNGLYDRQGLSYSGKVTIRKQSVNTFSISVVCEEFGLNAQIDNVKVSKGADIVYLSNWEVSNWDSLPEFWTLDGSIDSKMRLGLSVVCYVYGSSAVEGTDIYHFVNGKK